MEWLLGSGNVLGIASVVGLAFLLWKMSQRNHDDLESLIETLAKLGAANHTIQTHEQAIADRDQTLSALQRELDGARKANEVLRAALEEAQTHLAESGDPRGVDLALRSALDSLRVLSDVPTTDASETSEGDQDP